MQLVDSFETTLNVFVTWMHNFGAIIAYGKVEKQKLSCEFWEL